MCNQASLDIEIYDLRLASLIEESAKQGNTAVFTVLPKHLPLEDIRHFSAELTQLGYQVRLEVEEFLLSFKRVLDLKLRFEVLVYIVWIK